MLVYVPLFIPVTCTTAAAPTGHKRDSLQNDHGTWALPLYRCRCREQVYTLSRMTSWIVPWLCGGCRCSKNVHRRYYLNPVACGSFMSKKLSGAAGMPWFRVCMVVGPTNQNIRRTQSRKNRHLANANREYNAYRNITIIEGFISVDGERSIG
jgi:hypothetical protein